MPAPTRLRRPAARAACAALLRRPARWVPGLRAAALLAAVPAVVAAQDAGPPAEPRAADGTHAPPASLADADGHPFRTPRSSAVEPVHRLAFVLAERDADHRVEAIADIGDRLGFWIRRGDGGSLRLAGAVHAGALSRFDLESPNNNFLEVHYRVGFLLRAGYRRVAARAELYHVSSHLGDEIFEFGGRQPISTSREGFDLLFQAALFPGASAYAGGGVLLRSTRDLRRLTFRSGFDWESTADSWARPYVAGEAFGWSEFDWDPIIALEAGVALGRGARLGLLTGFGPSRAEQFFGETETLFGLSVSYVR